MSVERTPRSDKELWQSLATIHDSAPAPVSAVEFAAWLDGRLSETAASRIEAAVAADPGMRKAAFELADILDKPLPVAPARLEVRARALVGFEVERRAEDHASLFDWLFAKSPRPSVQRALALTAAVAIAMSGFLLGGGLGRTVAEERYAANLPHASDVSNANELTEFVISDGI